MAHKGPGGQAAALEPQGAPKPQHRLLVAALPRQQHNTGAASDAHNPARIASINICISRINISILQIVVAVSASGEHELRGRGLGGDYAYNLEGNSQAGNQFPPSLLAQAACDAAATHTCSTISHIQ